MIALLGGCAPALPAPDPTPPAPAPAPAVPAPIAASPTARGRYGVRWLRAEPGALGFEVEDPRGEPVELIDAAVVVDDVAWTVSVAGHTVTAAPGPDADAGAVPGVVRVGLFGPAGADRAEWSNPTATTRPGAASPP